MEMEMENWQCPVVTPEKNHILLGHGSGGELTHQLIQNIFHKHFQDPALQEGHDSVSLDLQLKDEDVPVMSTDSFVVKPLFFSGGNIGKIAVIGTVNDLAMSGAKPLYMSCAFILEEGLAFGELEKIVATMAEEASRNGLAIVCGDTKVVERGKGDGVFINTTGLGRVPRSKKLSPRKIQEGDVILISGDIGRHGMAIMSEREHLQFQSQIVSDCQSLWPLVQNLQEAALNLHCLRDLSRGGLATNLVELAEASGHLLHINEQAIPVEGSVRAACEVLGLDPLFVANEGTCVVILPETEVAKAQAVAQAGGAFPHMKVIGRVGPQTATGEKGKLYLKTLFGLDRRLFRLSGDQLPRIC